MLCWEKKGEGSQWELGDIALLLTALLDFLPIASLLWFADSVSPCIKRGQRGNELIILVLITSQGGD